MLTRRNRVYHLRRRVPKRYQEIEKRIEVVVSLKTDSEEIARQKGPIVWQAQIDGWEAMLAGDSADAERRYAAAVDLAGSHGFRYLTAPRVAELPVDEIVSRVEGVRKPDGTPDKRKAAAILGGVEEPPVTVSRALELYWTLARDKAIGKSPDQLRRWKNPRKKAVANFVAVVGDKPLPEITGGDMLDFREWWLERMEREGVTPNSGNKDLTHLGDVLKTVVRMKRMGLVLPLSDLSFKEGRGRQRPSFSSTWVRDKLLAPDALSGLNPEARAIVLVMVNTGARPSELAALRPREIRLDNEVPHVSLEAIDRQLKSENARRTIPLVGVSLEALRGSPDGFPRYRENSAGLSGTVNKYLRVNGLLETPEHTLYGLRHSFEDRMLEAGIDERIRRDLMGHALGRERYGEGGRLGEIRRLLLPIAF